MKKFDWKTLLKSNFVYAETNSRFCILDRGMEMICMGNPAALPQIIQNLLNRDL